MRGGIARFEPIDFCPAPTPIDKNATTRAQRTELDLTRSTIMVDPNKQIKVRRSKQRDAEQTTKSLVALCDLIISSMCVVI
jgi:hypothetical protein